MLQDRDQRPDALAQAITTLIKSDPERYLDAFELCREECMTGEWEAPAPKVQLPFPGFKNPNGHGTQYTSCTGCALHKWQVGHPGCSYASPLHQDLA